MGIPDHLTCLLRNLYAGQETTVRTGHGTTDWFQIGKGVCQCCILSPYLFNLYAESVSQFSRSVVSDSLQPHESQHARPPCPSQTPGVYSNSCPFELVMPFNHLIFCHPLLLLPPIPPSIRVFSSESTLLMRWPKYWEFQLQHQSFQ